MSKSRIEKNWNEAIDIANRFFHDKHMLTKAMVQFAEREKIRVLNNYRRERGEPLIDVASEPSRYPNGQDFDWIIDVPKSWNNIVDKLDEKGNPYPKPAQPITKEKS